MAKYISPGSRFMDIAYFVDKNGIAYDKEALLLALLVHTKGKTNRSEKELKEIQRLLDDPNLD